VRTDFLPAVGVWCGHGSSDLQIFPNAAVEIDTSFLPLSLNGSLAHTLIAAISSNEKPQKNFQVNDFHQRWIGFLKLVQRFADPIQLVVVNGVPRFGPDRSNLELTSAFLCTAASGIVNDQSSHHSRSIPHESRAIWELYCVSLSNLNICLMQKSCGAEAYRKALSRQVTLCKSTQF
jgi:hypothetical protein